MDGTQDDVASTRRLEPQAHHGGKGGSSGRRQTLCTHTHTHTHTHADSSPSHDTSGSHFLYAELWKDGGPNPVWISVESGKKVGSGDC